MANFKITLTVPAEDAEAAQQLAVLLQDVTGKVAYKDMIKLLTAASKKPAIIKAATKFV